MVNYSVKIDFMDKFLPDYVNLLKEAEEYDRIGDEVNYDLCAEAIDNGAKLMCMGGRINSVQWDILVRRYRR